MRITMSEKLCKGIRTDGKQCTASAMQGQEYCYVHASPSRREANLLGLSYPDYLQSEHWKRLSEETKRLAGYRCQVCNSEEELHAHHRTYERKGDELQSDLIALCFSCHKLFHEREKVLQFINLDITKEHIEQLSTISSERDSLRRKLKFVAGIIMLYKEWLDVEIYSRLDKLLNLSEQEKDR